MVHQQIPGVFCRFHKQLPHSKKCVWGVNFSLTEKMKKTDGNKAKPKTQFLSKITSQIALSTSSLKVFSQDHLSKCFCSKWSLKVMVCSFGDATNVGMLAKPRAKHCWNLCPGASNFQKYICPPPNIYCA